MEATVETNFKRAFNIGYWLRKNSEKDFNDFLASLRHKENSGYKGYVAGGQQFEDELKKEEILKQMAEKKKTQGRSK